MAERIDVLLDLLNQRPSEDWKWRFEPNARGFSALNAVSLCNAALLAYSPQDDVRRFLSKWDFDLASFRPLRQADTQGFAVRGAAGAIVSFRGTEPTNILDWFSDFNYHSIDFCKSHDVEPSVIRGLVHGGFAAALNVVRNDLLQAVDALAKPGDSIWITGHSLGGALALLAAAVLRFEAKLEIAGLYTYGQPRVGDAEFCKALDQALDGRFFRYVNDQDIVPHVPAIGLPHPLELRMTALAQSAHASIKDKVLGLAGEVGRLLKPETFSHCRKLMMFAKDGPLITNETELDRAWDQRETPIGLKLKEVFTKAPQLIREALNKDVLRDARLIDHDPRHGYLPKLVLQVDDPNWRRCYPLALPGFGQHPDR
jgi:triacylglycerol lipase